MRTLVTDNLLTVTAILRRRGVPFSDIDDEVQRTFIVAARRLDDVELGAERSFVSKVALHLASHARRKINRSREVLPESELHEPVSESGTPESLIGGKQTLTLLDAAIAGIPGPLRSVFRLAAIDEVPLPEVAVLLGLPRGTVASRLRRARALLREQLVAIELAADYGLNRAGPVDDAVLAPREEWTPLEHALLAAGASARVSSRTRENVLASLGLAPDDRSLRDD